MSVVDTERWLRLIALVHFGGIDALKEVLNDPNVTGLPVDQGLLFNFLDGYRYGRNNRSTLRNDLDKGQQAIVFPPSGLTDISLFDVTLSSKLLLHQICANMIKRSNPTIHLDMDNPVVLNNPNLHLGDFITFLRDARNFIIHKDKHPIAENIFNTYWNTILRVLKGIHNYDVTKVKDLKDSPIGTAKYSNAFLYAHMAYMQTEFAATMQAMVPHITKEVSCVTGGMKKQLEELNSKLDAVGVNIAQLLQDSQQLLQNQTLLLQNQQAHFQAVTQKLEDLKPFVQIREERPLQGNYF